MIRPGDRVICVAGFPEVFQHRRTLFIWFWKRLKNGPNNPTIGKMYRASDVFTIAGGPKGTEGILYLRLKEFGEKDIYMESCFRKVDESFAEDVIRASKPETITEVAKAANPNLN